MIVLPNGSYSLELKQSNEQDGTVVVTLKFKRVGEVQQPVQDQFKTVEQVQEILSQTIQTSNTGDSPWSQSAKTEAVVQQTPDLNQVRQETQKTMNEYVSTQPQTQTQPAGGNPWNVPQQTVTQAPSVGTVGTQETPTLTQAEMPVMPGWGGQQVAQQVTQPVTQPTQPVNQPITSPWGVAPTAQVHTQQPVGVSTVQVETQTTTAVMEPPVATPEDKKPKRGRKPKEDAAVQPMVSEINLNGLRTHTQPDGTVIFTKNADNNINDPFIIKYPTNDEYFTIEVYKPAFLAFGDLLNKYNAQLNEEKGCGVLTINEEIFTVEFLPLMVR